jgi:hypothetical protein
MAVDPGLDHHQRVSIREPTAFRQRTLAPGAPAAPTSNSVDVTLTHSGVMRWHTDRLAPDVGAVSQGCRSRDRHPCAVAVCGCSGPTLKAVDPGLDRHQWVSIRGPTAFRAPAQLGRCDIAVVGCDAMAHRPSWIPVGGRRGSCLDARAIVSGLSALAARVPGTGHDRKRPGYPPQDRRAQPR